MKSGKRLLPVIIFVFLVVFTVPPLHTVSAAATPDYFMYTVVSGDMLWKLSAKFHVSIAQIQAFNNMGSSTMLYVGQKLKIPVYDITKVVPPVTIIHTIAPGDTLWKLSQYYKVSIQSICTASGISASAILCVGKQLKIPIPASQTQPPAPSDTEPYVTYQNYKVVAGDTVWSISVKFNVPMQEIIDANKLTGKMYLSIGQIIKVPVHHVPVTPTPGAQYGEYLDWWTQAQYVWPIGKEAVMMDFRTGTSIRVKRTTGANHADVETLTAEDTAKMKALWGGAWNWAYRPVLIIVDGRKIAASAAGMPHAGLDAYPAEKDCYNRSGGYGYGPNWDYIKGNNMDGHFDIHFRNSTSHKTGEIVPGHQDNIKIAAGVK